MAPAVKKKEEKQSVVQFWSKWSDFCLNCGVKKTRDEVYGKDIFSPHTVKFLRGEYSTDDPKEIAAIRKCKYFGVAVHERDGKDQDFVKLAQQKLAEAIAEVNKAGGKVTTPAAAAASGEGSQADLAASFTDDGADK